MNKLFKKIIAVLLLTFMISSNLSIIGGYGISYALSENELSSQDSKTQNLNVEFNSYFEGGVHSKTEKIENTTKLFVNIKVKNSGYLENSTINFSNENFKIAGQIQNDNIQSVDVNANRIVLGKLNNGTDITLEIPIKMLNRTEVELDNFNKETNTNFTATYVDGNGKSNSISKQVVNKLSWDGTDSTKGILKTDVTKKIPYNIGEKYGVLLQFYVEAGIENNTLPIKTTKIEVESPKLNSIKPTSANAIAISTEATNGEKDGMGFTTENYSYDASTGILTINVANKQDKISWLKNVQDKYLVTFIFDTKEAYDYVINNTSKIETGIKVKSEIEVYNGQQTIAKNNAEKSFSYTIGTGTTVSMPTEGETLDFDITTISNMNKSQVYANYEAENKKETSYNVKYYATVCDVDLTDKVEFTQGIDQFLTSENTKNATTVAGKNYSYNKTVKINKNVFTAILGEEGSIQLCNTDRTEIAKIDKTTSVSNDEYVVDISAKNNNQLLVITSKPVAPGRIIMEVEKAIKTSIYYTKDQFKTFKNLNVSLNTNVDGKEVSISKDITLNEPKTVIDVTVSKNELTTVIENKNVEIRAILDTSTTNNALYKNPTLKIKLPSYIESININDYDILMGNGLKITSVKPEKESGQIVINVKLEGNQTEYTIDAQYKGAIVMIDTNLTANTLTPTNKNKIVVEYQNNNEVATNAKGTIEKELNFIAPTGMVTANGISNYADGKADLLSISDEGATGTIAKNSEARTATVYGKIINNYPNAIKDVVILGKIPSKGNTDIDTNVSLGSTFDTKIKQAVTLKNVDAANYTVYYSTIENASKDLTNTANGWTTTFSENAKSYMIVLPNKQLQTGDMIEFSYNIEIPANISYNNSTYQMYKVSYTNVSDVGELAESKTSSIICLTTGQGPELSVELKSTADVVREGQIVKMKATVKNTGSLTAKNVKAVITLPKYASFTDYVPANGFYSVTETEQTIEIGTLEANQSKDIYYYLKIDDNTNTNVNENSSHEEIEAGTTYPKQVKHQIYVIVNESTEKEYSNECNLSIQEGKIALELISDTYEDQILQTGDIMEYTIKVTNISGFGPLTNTKVSVDLPTGIKFNDALIKNSELDETGSKDGISYDESLNSVTINLGTLDIQKEIILSLKIENIDKGFSIIAKANADETEECYSNITEYIAEKVKLEVSQLTATPNYVKETENLTYSLKLANKGKGIITNIKIKDVLPEELTVEKVTYTYNNEEQQISYSNNEMVIPTIMPGEETELKLIAEANLLPDKNDKKITNKMSVTANGFDEVQTNTVTNTIEYYAKAHNQENGSTDPDNPNNPNTPATERYKITGTAWLDSNKNGMRDAEEELLANVKAILVNKSTNAIVKDVDTKQEKSTTTNNSGYYEFDNIEAGQYFVLFVYDAGKYSITEYQKTGIDESVNSDSVDIEVILHGEKTIAGITDTITVSDSNIRDIDIGLYNQEKFDLRLDKYISKITRTTPTSGTDVFEYNNEKLTKIEVLKKNLEKSSIVIEYKIVVKNEGAVAGYAKKVADYLPKGVVFNTELNKDWYLSDNGNVYNTSLENTLIKPGESKELTLVLVKQITEDSIGVLNNTAEIYEAYNEQGLKDIDSSSANKVETEDDMSKADIVLGIVTGAQIAMYITLPIVVIALLAFGAFEIKKRVLNK